MKAQITFDRPITTDGHSLKGNTVEILFGEIYKGKDGKSGLSAYESAKLGGYDGTEEQFYKSLSNPLSIEITGTI